MVQKTSLRRVLYARSLWYVGVCLFVIFGLLLNTFLGSLPKTAEAATSSTMNFQARLLSSSGALVPDGYYNVQFKLHDAATSGNNVWTETYKQTDRVRVANGYLSVNLGSVTAFGSSINWDQEHWLTMNVGGTANTPTPTWDGEMTPRLKLTAVPYAFQAGQLTKQSGSNRGVLQFNNLTANRTINLPDESGTLCIQNSANCGFLTGVPGNYIQNGTAPQTADFNITGQGTVGGTMTANLFQGSGASLTSLNASNISSGTLNDARLSSNVMLLTGNQTVTGIKTFDNTVDISGSNKLIFGGDVELYRVAANVLQLHNSNLRSQRSNAADSAYSARVSGDSVSRLMIRADGGMSWGDGTNPRDVSLQRQASGYLRLGGNFEVTGTYLGLLSSNATIAFGSGGDVNLYRGGSNLLQTDDAFNVVGALTQNGNAVCTVAGNCAGLGGNGDILQGGNSFGPGGMTIGTNDEYGLNLETNGISRVTVSSTNGNVHVHTGVLNVVSGSIQTNSVSRISNAGVLQNVTANANILTSGTLDDARLSSNVMLLTGNQTVTGIKTFNNTVNISGSNQVVLGGDANLYRSAANVLKTDDSLHIAGSSGLNGPGGSTVGLYLSDNQIGVRRSASNQGVFIADVQGDAQARFVITAAGTILWGDGTNARDTNLYRSAANLLQTDDNFNVVGALTQNGSTVCTVAGNCAGVGGNGDILQGGNTFGAAMAIGTNDNYNLDFRTNNAVQMTLTTAGQLQLPVTGNTGGLVIGGDTNLYRGGTNILSTADNFTAGGYINAFNGSTNQVALGRTASGVAGPGITFGNDQDTNLYRSAANTLRTDDNFSVGGTITGNGSGLTSLNASNISSGTLNDARLSSNVMLLSGAQNVTGVKTFNATLNMQGSNAITLGSDVSLSRTAANVLGLATGDSFNLISGNLQFGGTTVIDSSRVLQNVTANASIITAGTLNDARLSSNVALLNATANFTGALQQNGNAVCTVAGNCAGVGGTGDILQGGNSFTEAMTIGTNDNYALNFETNGTTRMTISNAGAVSTTGNLSVGGTLSGNGSGLTSLNGSNISSGTVANARLVNSGALTVTAGNGLTGGGSVALGASTSLAIGAGDGITVNTTNVAVDSSVCRTSGNCAGVGGTGDILQGGNSFTAAMTIGTNDNYALNFETNNITRMTIANNGAVSTTGSLSVGGTISGNGSGLTALNATQLTTGTVASARIAGSYTGITGVGALNAGSITSGFGNINIGSSTFTGNGSGLTSLNGTNITTGTVADARLSSNVMLLDNAQTITGIKTFNNTLNMQGANQIVLGGDTNLYRSAANTLTTDDNLQVLGRTTQFSNEYPVYRWNFGGSTDLNWKKIADISIGTGAYKAAAFRVDITDTLSNHGQTSNIAPMTYFVSAYRSGAVQDSVDSGSVSGPVPDYVRLVKTALGEYELQVRQPVNYRNILVQAQVLSQDGATVIYADSPANGSTVGSIYTASPTGWTQDFANIDVKGNLQTGGTTRLTNAGILQNVSMDAAQLTGTVADARLTSNIARLNAAANFTAGLQVSGNNVCHAGNNCGFASSSNAILQGGNSFGATGMTIGTNDNYDLNFETNGTTRMTISSAGAVSTTGNLSVGGTLSGNGSGLTSLNATNISSGTLSDARLSTNVMQLNNNQIVTGIKTFNNTVNISGSNQLVFGGDVNLYRDSANVLRTNDNLSIGGGEILLTQSLSTIRTNHSVGLLIQNNAMTPGSAGGGLHLTGGSHSNSPSRGGIWAGATSDLGTYTARGTTASGIELRDGTIQFRANTGLTPGNTFTPTSRLIIDGSTGNANFGGDIQTGGTTRLTSAGVLQNVSMDATQLTGTINDARLSSNVALKNINNNFSTSQTITGTVTATAFQGSGASLTSLNAGNISSGTLAVARGGTGITSVGSAGSIAYSTGSAYAFSAAGTSGQCLISGGTGAPTWGACGSSGTFVNLQAGTPGTAQTGHLNITGTAIAGTFSGSGASLTALNATQLTTGTVASARISGSYTGITGTGALNAGSISSGFGNINIGSSTFTGNGSGLTSLNGTNISTGTVADARLSSNVALLNRNSQIFTGNEQVFRNGTNSANAFRVQNAAGSTAFGVDTSNAGYAMIDVGGAGYDFSEIVLHQGATASWGIGTDDVDDFYIYKPGSGVAMALSEDGEARFRNFDNSSNAFRIQNSAGTDIFRVSTASNSIYLDGDTSVEGWLDAYGGFSSYGATQVIDNSLGVYRDSFGESVFFTQRTGDSGYPFTILNSGEMAWGDGTNSADTFLYRNSAGVLRAEGTFRANAFNANGSAGSTVTCSGGQFLQNQIVVGGIVTGGTCAAAGPAGTFVNLQSGTPGTAQTGHINVTGTVIAANLQGNGSALTALNATNIGSGTLADGRLSSNVMLLSGAQNVTGVKTFNATVNVQGANSLTFGGDASLSRTAANVLGLATGDSFNIVNGSLQFGGTTVITSARVLQNVTASAGILTSGTVADARLTANVALLNRNGQIFTGNDQIFRSTASNALRVQNAGGDTIFRVNTEDEEITLNAYTYMPEGARVGEFSSSGTVLTIRAASGNNGIYLNSNTSNSPFMTWSNGTQEFRARTNDTHFSLGHGSFTPTFTLSNIGQVALQNSTNSTTAFQIQNSSSTALLTADTTNSRITVGNDNGDVSLRVGGGTNRIETNGDNQLRLYGSARNAKKITLTPEYAGAVLDGTGIGSMTAGFDSGSYRNYYVWTSNEASAQTYSVVVQVPVPSDWDAWGGSPAVSIDMWSSSTSEANGTVTIVGSDGVIDVNSSSMTPGVASAWATKTISSLNASRYSADGVMTIKINMSAQNAETFRVGKITLDYLSKF